jgi:hypothetical protein
MLRHTKGFMERPTRSDQGVERAWKALQAAARGDLRHTSGWAGECAREEWSQKQREYNKRYRERHRERELFFGRIYVARHRARAKGQEPPALPDWDKNPEVFEVSFARGGCSKAGI